ncbi:hypothetical protein KHM83_11805 [Fusibacter paucivorans]|uniref:Cache domain-containing protein n=1 Tax=Fusibacter paucivorans TaxID=76009 RepID=A0ABS5PQM1_9FIRM|nr:hypothetical protein [Fusibacter paucivorans]MBS7527366.1 hypothetical protein [Fusibacter paucivorans]
MKRIKRNVIIISIYSIVFSLLLYNVSQLGYNGNLKKEEVAFMNILNALNERIEAAKMTQNILTTSCENVKENQLMHYNDKLPHYANLSYYQYEELISPYAKANLSISRINWLMTLYDSEGQKVISDPNNLIEHIVIGSRYGKPGTLDSGVIAIEINLKGLVADVAKEASVGSAGMIVSNPQGEILYFENYQNALKPNIAELFPKGHEIASSSEQISIKKVIFQGTAFLVFQRELKESELVLTCIVPWIDVFYQWQIYTIFMGLLMILFMIILYHYIKNDSINKEIKDVLRIADRYIDDNSIEGLAENMRYKDNMAAFFEIELLPIVEVLRILNTFNDEMYEKHKQQLGAYLSQKSEMLYAHTIGEINYDRAWLKKFEITEITAMLFDVMTAVGNYYNKEVVLEDVDVVPQTIYSYPNAIWVVVMSLFEHLIHYQNQFIIRFKMRGELVFTFKTNGVLQYDDSKIERIRSVIHDKYNATLSKYDETLHLEWPFIKYNHLPMQMADRFDEMTLSGYKLSYASERILRLIGEQLHFEFVPYSVDSGEHHLILVEAEKMYQLADAEIEMLKQLPNVVLIYMGQHHDHWLWSEKINAVGILSLPLTVEKVRKLLNTLMNTLNTSQKSSE